MVAVIGVPHDKWGRCRHRHRVSLEGARRSGLDLINLVKAPPPQKGKKTNGSAHAPNM